MTSAAMPVTHLRRITTDPVRVRSGSRTGRAAERHSLLEDVVAGVADRGAARRRWHRGWFSMPQAAHRSTSMRPTLPARPTWTSIQASPAARDRRSPAKGWRRRTSPATVRAANDGNYCDSGRVVRRAAAARIISWPSWQGRLSRTHGGVQSRVLLADSCCRFASMATERRSSRT